MLAKVFILFSAIVVVFGGEHVLPTDACKDMESNACQNFQEARMNAINNQINLELYASYVYMSMGSYFSRDDPNHKGYAKFFFAASAEEREHALKFIDYLNMRGGQFKPLTLQAPSKYEWTNGLDAMQDALALEKRVNKALLVLHQGAHNDPQMQDFIEGNYLNEQVESIRELAGYVNELKSLRVTNPGLGEHLFNEKLLK